MAAIFAGGLGAGIYTTNSPEAVCHILKKSLANIVVVEDEKQMDKIKLIRDQLPLLKAVIQLTGKLNDKKNDDGCYLWSELESLNVTDMEEKYAKRLAAITPNQSASLIFTVINCLFQIFSPITKFPPSSQSGTVGMPKGVLLSHDNLMWNARQIEISFQSYERAKEVVVSYLPLSHIAGQIIDVFYAATNAATVYFADKNALKGSLINTLRIARPTRFLGVPRVFEKFQAALSQQTNKLYSVKRHILNWAKYYAMQHHLNTIRGQPTKAWQYLLAKKTVLRKVKMGLGMDRCETMIVGAAPTAMEVKEFFLSLDMPLMECYGMSEMGGPSTLSDVQNFRLDAVGKAIPGSFMKVFNPDESGHGEVAFKGRNVFMGYIGEEEKTTETLDENGWLHTGDIGFVDKDGFLYITGRIKELIITAGGENIPPAHIEELVGTELPCVSNCFLVGDQRKYLTMLITLKTEMDGETGAPKDELVTETKTWMKGLGVSYKTISEVMSAGPCPQVR